jgi:hypothetical protein
LNFVRDGVSYAAAGAPPVPETVPGPIRNPATRPCVAPSISDRGEAMMIRRTTLFVATLFAAGTAFAFHCPQDMKKIDDAMAKNPKLTAAQADEVKKYRAEGETLHKAGKHQESVDTLAKAMKILDVK